MYYLNYDENFLTGPLFNTSLPEFTFSAWVNARAGGGFPHIFSWGDHTKERISFFLQPPAATSPAASFGLGFVVSRFSKTVQTSSVGAPTVRTGASRLYTSLDSVVVPYGEWKHVLVRFRNTGTGNNRVMEYEAFLDGVSKQTGSQPLYNSPNQFVRQWLSDTLGNYQVTSAQRFTVGGILNVSGGGLNLFGALDNLRIYKSYLSDVEVAALYAEKNQNPTAVDPTSQIGFSVYPNPTTENLNLQMDQPLGGTLRILDLTGRVLQTTELSTALNHQVNVSQLTSGLYIAQLNGASLRFVKQ
jgi:hypothetical protein